MRPVARGDNPTHDNFNPYRKAKPYLKDSIGSYCSYCEREISHALEVEHIKPKSEYPDLKYSWENFLIACKNCNSTKGSKDLSTGDIILPDRDNSFYAFDYKKDGHIKPSDELDERQKLAAENTISEIGLDKEISHSDEENIKGVSLDRISDRQEAYLTAKNALKTFKSNDSNKVVECIVKLAKETGFFSIWMKVFNDKPTVKTRLIDGFEGTASSCFDDNGEPVSPRQNGDTNHLSHAGKV